MPSSARSEPCEPRPVGWGYWCACFDALATGPLLLKPHTVRRRAGEGARLCPYPEVATAGLVKVRTASRNAATVHSVVGNPDEVTEDGPG